MQEFCDLLTDVILGAAIGWILVLCIVGLRQWIQRGSLFKVDKWLFVMGVIMVIMGVIYVLFDKVWILGYSPKDPTKPSFPSSHTMVVWTICLAAMAALDYLVKNKKQKILVMVILGILMMAVAVGRVLSGEHTVADVVVGAGIAGVLSLIYTVILKRIKLKEKEKNYE